MKTYQYIVVGSGCTGAMAAQTLVEAGVEVAMLDVGETDPNYQKAIPKNRNFLSVRKNEQDQYKYLIGKNFEGISWGKVGKGEQITPPRKHIFKSVEKLIPVISKTFLPAESLGYGGLGIGWGVGCWEFSRQELEKAGLNYEKMQSAYNIVSNRIGVSATKDSASNYTLGPLESYHPSPKIDRNHEIIYKNYLKKESSFKKDGFIMGRAPLAVITKDKDQRKKYEYKELDFYSDSDQSAYRPWITVDKLRKSPHLTYIGNQLVMRFKEFPDYTEVYSLDTKTGGQGTFRCKKLILTPGVLGSARIVLRSLGKNKNIRLPLLCNPYSYVPCIQPRMLGKGAEPKKLGFAQLSLFLDESGDHTNVAMASLYGYQSLMLFRIARQAPLNFNDSRILFQYLSPAIVIMGIHQPDAPSSTKYLQLVDSKTSPTGDALKASYELSEDEKEARRRREAKYMNMARKLHIYPLKKIDPGAGSSIHYAGTIPFSDKEEPFTLSKSGRLHGTKTVFVADGSGFTYLPAKGLTFSLMANAHITAENALKYE